MRDAEIEAHRKEFERNGWLSETGTDKAGKRYSAHRHGWTRLITLAGSVKLKRENHKTQEDNWVELTTGDVCDIESGQLHEAIVGPNGWQWLAAWRPEEDDTFSVHG